MRAESGVGVSGFCALHACTRTCIEGMQQHSGHRYATHLLPMMSSTLALISSVILSRYLKLCSVVSS